ncbi:hypothetical protein AB0H73_36410 [Streptomyces olivoreticuli]
MDTSGVGFGHRLMAGPFIAYGSFCLRATQSAGRRQELAADRMAARIAGRDAAASALREVAVLDAARDCYLGDYASAGTPAGLLPPHGQLLQALPDDGRATRTPERHALALLHDPERVYADLETATFAPEALAMRRAQWRELRIAGRASRVSPSGKRGPGELSVTECPSAHRALARSARP